ncbi:hypothetical protein [Anoxybacillus suryakundensis]|uniref:UPF0738 protein Ga0061060_103212 n=1 Tax=Anoxybacillus suryakundensis TaxID=1325335 RepID=A0A0K6GLE9_9BACL|nr:hypothetical protein [Anoxybacillus suryakundensis]CUA79388.1 hypothetical protein Ga0061060_103212 [Anoxybacillus suryakundensis]
MDGGQKMKIYVHTAEKKEHGWYVTCEASLQGLKPKRHMLVDSDECAFVYILEASDAFVYVVMSKDVWGAMKEALRTNEPMFLVGSDATIELEGIHEEVTYLIENIKGNANYGEEMEQAVTAFFA